MRSVLVALILVAGSVKAFGQSLPNYDSELNCKSTAGQFADKSTQDFFVRSCLELQSKSAAQVRRIVPFFDRETLSRCDKQARAMAGGSYQVLAGCLALDVATQFLEGKIELVHKADQSKL